ncbi:unnamed protein product [Thlaspi arvense]|uniref:TMEM131L fifth Ig-like domain-containing protein n=1 Tax=Thlaspi arvense TaxID=13288 RepID=A0AAU9RHU5_THLAR|nr:unnamed protein product [Thlaspi arvense]
MNMERKTLATTRPLLLTSFLFHLRGAAFGSSKAFHCLLLLSCLLLSSVNTLHNLDGYDSCGYNIAASKVFQSFKGGDSESVAIQNVCPSSHLFSLLSALRSENQFDPFVPFFGLSCPSKSWSNSALKTNNLSGVVWLSLKPVHIIEFQPFTEFLHIGDTTTCYKPLSNKDKGRELSVSVSGRQCGGNGFMQQNQCEGFSLEAGDAIKFLFFYQTDFSWASGVAVFRVPTKATAPVLMLSLCKKTVFWVRTKKFSIAVLIAAAALLILMFWFNDHFVDEENESNNGSHVAVRKVEKPSTITISPEMDSLLRSISKESSEVSENSINPIASVSSSSCQAETSEEAVSLTVKTAKDKKRRRNKKKKKGAISGLASERNDVSSSHSGNSTPRSPMSPEPPITQAAAKPVKPPKPALSHSATFPVSGVKSMIIQSSSLAPNVRAPGSKSRTQVKEEKAKEYRYDIWGDHLTGLHLMDRFKEVREGKSCSVFGENECESFFVKGPQNLLADSHARLVSFCNQWG